jgi:hypothetical protein
VRMSKMAGAGLRELMNRYAADAFGGVLHHGSRESDGGRRACQGHAHNFGGNSGARQVHQILRGELRPVQRRRRADIENGARIFAQGVAASAIDGQQIDQGVQACRGEGSGNDGLFRIPQHKQKAVPVADLLRHVVADHGG